MTEKPPSVRRFNFEHACFCGRRADYAIGKKPRYGWFCLECGPKLALKVYGMTGKDFDFVESRALARVKAKIGTDLAAAIPAEELEMFLRWLLREFADAIREEAEAVAAPF